MSHVLSGPRLEGVEIQPEKSCQSVELGRMAPTVERLESAFYEIQKLAFYFLKRKYKSRCRCGTGPKVPYLNHCEQFELTIGSPTLSHSMSLRSDRGLKGSFRS